MLYGKFMKMRTMKIAAWLFVLVSAISLFWQVTKRIDHPGSDFMSYYTAGYLVLEGEPIARFYNDDWFRAELNKMTPDINDIYNANLPTMAIASVPIALSGDAHVARMVWMAVNTVALIYIMFILANIANMGPLARPFWYGAVFMAQPVSENFILGQVYIVITACLIWVYQSVDRKQEQKAGIILAILLMAKTAGTMLWPYFIIHKRWKLLCVAIVSVLVIIIATFPMIGIEGWQAYLDRVEQLKQSPYQSVTAYQSIEGWFQHMFSPHPMMQTEPIIALPLYAAHTMSIGVTLTLLSMSLWLVHKTPNSTDLHYATFILLILVCMPVTLLHAYVMAIIPVALLLKVVRQRIMTPEGIMILIGAAMILLPLPYKSSRFFDGYWSLLAYPKLYGALLLWTVAVWLTWKEKSIDIEKIES